MKPIKNSIIDRFRLDHDIESEPKKMAKIAIRKQVIREEERKEKEKK